MTRTAVIDQPGSRPLVRNDDIPSAKAASSRRFWGVKERAYRVGNPDGLELEKGDTVEIFLPPGRTAWSAAITFLLPLALFPIGFALAGSLFPGAPQPAAGAEATAVDEGVAFLVGFGFLLAGIPLGYLIRKLAGGLAAVPVVTRVLNPIEAAQCRLKANAEGCGSCKACG